MIYRPNSNHTKKQIAYEEGLLARIGIVAYKQRLERNRSVLRSQSFVGRQFRNKKLIVEVAEFLVIKWTVAENKRLKAERHDNAV